MKFVLVATAFAALALAAPAPGSPIPDAEDAAIIPSESSLEGLSLAEKQPEEPKKIKGFPRDNSFAEHCKGLTLDTTLAGVAKSTCDGEVKELSLDRCVNNVDGTLVHDLK